MRARAVFVLAATACALAACSSSGTEQAVCAGASCEGPAPGPLALPPGEAPAGRGLADAGRSGNGGSAGQPDAGAAAGSDATRAADVHAIDAGGQGPNGGTNGDAGATPPPGDVSSPGVVDGGQGSADGGLSSGDAAPSSQLSCGQVLACADNCPPGDGACAADCATQGSPEAQVQVAALWTCLQGHCAGQEGEALLMCLGTYCAKPFAQCVAQGDVACVPTVGCLLNCQGDACGACGVQASPQGLEGATRLVAGVFQSCTGQSGECALTALLDDVDALKACGLLDGKGSCRSAATCVRDCFTGSLDDFVTCELQCVETLRPSAVNALKELVGCVVDQCLTGYTLEPLGCAASEMTWKMLCSAQWKACPEDGGD